MIFTYDTSDTYAGKLGWKAGGTGLITSPSLLVNLASTSAANVFQSSPRPGVTGILPVSQGGTGKASLTAKSLLYGNGTSAIGELPIT